MADLASTDITIKNSDGNAFTPGDLTIVGRQKRGLVKLTFGDGALTYPSGGVPLPAKAYFGMLRDINLTLYDSDDATGIVWKYDKTNHKLRGYIQGVTVSAAGSATLDDYALNTTVATADGLASVMSVSLSNTVGSGTYYLGKLKEIGDQPDASGTSMAPPATTLFAEVVGW